MLNNWRIGTFQPFQWSYNTVWTTERTFLKWKAAAIHGPAESYYGYYVLWSICLPIQAIKAASSDCHYQYYSPAFHPGNHHIVRSRSLQSLIISLIFKDVFMVPDEMRELHEITESMARAIGEQFLEMWIQCSHHLPPPACSLHLFQFHSPSLFSFSV